MVSYFLTFFFFFFCVNSGYANGYAIGSINDTSIYGLLNGDIGYYVIGIPGVDYLLGIYDPGSGL